MRSTFDSFLRLDWVARFHLLEAAFALAAVWIGMRTAGYRRTRSALGHLSPSILIPDIEQRDLDPNVAELAWSVSAVSHHAPGSTTCLQRTLALWGMLHRRGIDSDVRVGTTKTDEGIQAHAWLERDGVVLNDEADIAGRYMAFKNFR